MDTTTLNVEYLTNFGACSEAIQFVKRNNLEHFPVSRINEIEGDHSGWVEWIKDMLNSVQEYDSNGDLIHYIDSDGYEYWNEYDSNGNLIHQKNSDGSECWKEYDSNGNEIHYKNSDGSEYWKEYDSNGNEIHYKHSNEYEHWKEYDSKGNIIHYKNSNGYECWKEYDSNGNLIHYKHSNGYEYWKEYDSNGNEIHHKNSNGYEYWKEYDSNGSLIHHKNSYGYEYWREYDSNGNEIHYKNSDGYECSFHTEYYPSGQLKRYGDMTLPELDNDSPTCYNNKTNGEVKMTNRTRKTTRYAVISRNTGKVLKNAPTREVARQWKRDSGKNGLGILDRNSGVVIS